MDNSNLTMEEYIRLEEEKARKHGKVFNWQTATFGKIRVDDDFYDLRSMEAEFPTIVVNDDFAPQDTLERKSQGLEYTDEDIADFEERMAMEHGDEAGVVVFTSQAWGRLFGTNGPLVWELILEFLSMLRFREVLLDLDTPGTIQFQLGRARRRLSWRQFILALGLHTGEKMESLGFTRLMEISWDLPLPTLIKDPVLRLCHQMMAYSIAGRSQAPKKVTVTDLFYLRGLDVGSVTIPYLLAQYLRKILGGLTVIALELPIIDMAELPDAVAGAPADVEDASIIDEGGQADPAPVQAPQQPSPPPPAPARTMPQSMARLEEDVPKIHGALTEQREVIDVMACYFSRFSTWVITGQGQMIDRTGVTYVPYSQTHIPYQRRVRQRTGEASTSAA
ncbi:hypothetical protein Tco_0047051 [Tanacetum coccineum]